MKTQVLTLTVQMPDDQCALDLIQMMIQAYRDTAPREGVKFTHIDWKPLQESRRTPAGDEC